MSFEHVRKALPPLGALAIAEQDVTQRDVKSLRVKTTLHY